MPTVLRRRDPDGRDRERRGLQDPREGGRHSSRAVPAAKGAEGAAAAQNKVRPPPRQSAGCRPVPLQATPRGQLGARAERLPQPGLRASKARHSLRSPPGTAAGHVSVSQGKGPLHPGKGPEGAGQASNTTTGLAGPERAAHLLLVLQGQRLHRHTTEEEGTLHTHTGPRNPTPRKVGPTGMRWLLSVTPSFIMAETAQPPCPSTGDLS